MIFNVIKLFALATALVLTPGIQAGQYKLSSDEATNCENQESFGNFQGFSGTCASLGGALFTVGFVEPAITTVTHLDDSLCGTEGVMVVKDASCNELYRAAAVCIRSNVGTGTYLLSCSNDIEVGTWGLPENIK
jgi:hypothetical protein